MVSCLSGNKWLGKLEAKVVMVTVTKAQTLGARKARILCISGGPHCDLEVAQQPRLVRAIKQEMEDPNFIVKIEWIEWMEMPQFREEYGRLDGMLGASVKGSPPATGFNECRRQEEKNMPDSKHLHSGSQAKDNRTKSKAEAKQSGRHSSVDSTARLGQNGAKPQKQIFPPGVFPPGVFPQVIFPQDFFPLGIFPASTDDQDDWLSSCSQCSKDFQTQQAV